MEKNISLTIKINTWNFPRSCIITPNAIKLQIATCYPCPTCEKRVAEARKTINKLIKFSEILENSSLSFEFSIFQAKSTKLEDILDFLHHALPSFTFQVLSGPEPSMEVKFLPEKINNFIAKPKNSENNELKVAKSLKSYSFCLKINTWGSPRKCVVSPSIIKLQIAICYPCPICDLRVDLVRRSLNSSIKSSELIENCFLSLEFPISQDKSCEINDIFDFLKLALPSFTFNILSGPESEEFPPPMQKKCKKSRILTGKP